jgi:hypothetical protein
MKTRDGHPTGSQSTCGGTGDRLPTLVLRTVIVAPNEDSISLAERKRLHQQTCPICREEANTAP